MIYIVSHFYLPVGSPAASRMGHLARILVERYGRDRVRVVTGRPNYPDGRLPAEYRWRIFRRTTGPAGEAIAHLYEIPAPFQGFLGKTIGYLSFAVSVFFYFLFRRVNRGSGRQFILDRFALGEFRTRYLAVLVDLVPGSCSPETAPASPERK